MLGCVLLRNECLNDCIASRAHPGWFFDVRNREVFKAMVELYDHKKAIDYTNLGGILRGQPPLEYLSSLEDATPTSFAIGDYIDTVRKKYVLRQVLSACTHVGQRTYEVNGDFDQFSHDAQGVIARAFHEANEQKQTPTIKTLVQQAVNRMEERFSNKGKLTGITTGLTDLDKLTDGLHPGEMIVLAARPSVGKTSLMLNIVDHIAVEQKIPVGVFSLEMSAASLVDRLIYARARINPFNIREGKLTEYEGQRLVSASAKLSNAPIYIDDTSGLTAQQFKARAIRMQEQFHIKALFLDYLQLMQGGSGENRQQDVTQISQCVKNTAKDLGVPVIALSQLNRLLEREKNRRPKLSDLRESGSLEQDADGVWLLYPPGEECHQLAQPINLLIGKNRNGPANEEVALMFLKTYTKFELTTNIEEQPRLPYNQ